MTGVRWAAGAVVAFALVLVAAPAQASDDETYDNLPLLPHRVMCVHPTFPVTGSGWKIQAAVKIWNERQSVIRLTTVDEPGCDVVYVHRYDVRGDNRCGYVDWAQTIDDAPWDPASPRPIVSGSDMYLNDTCLPPARLDPEPRMTRFVVAHELGHAMGLGHNKSTRSVMCSCFDWWKPADKLVAPVDVRDLSALYLT